MSRIAKSNVHAALERAGKNIIDARGNDPAISRKDIRQAAKQLPQAERALTEHFYRFIDHRDYKPGARVTESDVKRAVEYAKEKIVDKYDVNNNGLSKAEIGQMSRLGQLAVALAVDLRKTGEIGGAPTALATAALKNAIEQAAKLPNGDTVTYMSEADYEIEFVSADGGPDALSPAQLLRDFKTLVTRENDPISDLAVRQFSGADLREKLSDLSDPYDPDDSWIVDTAAAFSRVSDALNDNLTDLSYFKVGPKGSDGQMREDYGYYTYFILGKTRDGNVAGIAYGSVET